MSSSELNVLRAANFDWTLHLQSVWCELPFHIPNLQPDIELEFSAKLSQMKAAKAGSDSPLGWVLKGVGGVGKTHLLNSLRKEAARQRCAFILVDMTDVNDFWETVLIGYTNSLQEQYVDDQFQHRFLLHNLISQLSAQDAVRDNLKLLMDANASMLKKHVDKVLAALAKRYRKETNSYQDVLRALVAINSDNFNISNLGQTWLQGLAIEEKDAHALGLRTVQERPIQIIRALSWLISLSAPAVVAFDQLDPIVRQLEFDAKRGSETEDRRQEADANSIISGIGDGLRDMYDVTRRSLTVLSCLETSWEILENRVLRTSTDRFEEPHVLQAISDSRILKSIVSTRMKPACDANSFAPPQTTWPFCESAFEGISGVTPRELLKRCAAHRKRCLNNEAVSLLSSFGSELQAAPVELEGSRSELEKLDTSYKALQRDIDPAALLNEREEDEQLGPLVQSACVCLLKECSFPESVGAVLDREFTGGRKTKPLHARIRLVFHDEQEREEHFCTRALQRVHATAYQNRLKLAMTQSGIDRSLTFRRLVILRTESQPRGKVTARLTAQFNDAGGIFYAPTEDEIRRLYALRLLVEQNDPDLDAWLQSRKPASQLGFCRTAFASLLDRYLSGNPVPPTADPPVATPGETPPENGSSAVSLRQGCHPENHSSTSEAPTNASEKVADRSAASWSTTCAGLGDFPLGQTFIGGQHGDSITIPIHLLEKHVVVLAGAGSGKTVLLKRMIEEAALRNVPSIVIDGANDMAALGDRWPEPPKAWSAGDHVLADHYHTRVEKCLWTPGKRSGNPLRLELIPELTATLSDPDEFDAAVMMVSGAIADMLKLSSSKTDSNKRGVISKALRFYAGRGGSGVREFIDILAELPPEAMLGISKEVALAKEASDGLRVLCETDPMLSDSGDMLDPAILFGDDAVSDRTRVSIINFCFLSSQEIQQRFVNQLATTLFAWIKKHPDPPGRTLRGLLVIDEAKDFVPGRKSTPCKESLMRLTAQARKYHLGVVFATQNPREIENTIIGNCSTQYYGKASSPAAIATIREQLVARGGQGDDIGRLPRGVFYVYNADAKMRVPTKVGIPLCLSHHATLNCDEVLKRATRKTS